MNTSSEPQGLHRHLGMLDIFCISAGAMISSGLFILPGIAFGLTGPAMALAYLIAGILTIPALLSKAELATAMPRAGGVYFYIDRSMGAAMGTLGGLAAWFSLSFKSAFALIGMGAFIALLFPGLSDFELRIAAATCCLFFVMVNLLGAKHAGRLQIVMVLGLLMVLLVYVFAGVEHINTSRFTPFQTNGFEGLMTAVGLVFVSFGGLTKVASVAEEVRDPGRNLVPGMGLAFVVVLAFYVAVTLVTIGIVDGQTLSETLTPINLGAAVSMGTTGVIMVTIAAILAFISTANAGIMAASRVPMAMSRDLLLPPQFDRVHARRRTPTMAILMTGGSMVAVILALDLEGLIKTASTLKLLLFGLANLAVIAMRESRLQNYRPTFKSPLYPWVQIVGILASIVLIVAMGQQQVILATVFAVASFVWYAIYGRRSRLDKTSALTHILERISGRDQTRGTLSAELSEIVRQRDGINEDRFDRLVAVSPVLDLKKSCTLEEFYTKAAEQITDRLGLSHQEFIDGLSERENSTTVSPTTAITHTIIGGENRFEMLIVRCRNGVYFSEDAPAVKTIFVLLSSRDEDDFHRHVVNIAQVSKQPRFQRRWRRAKSEDDLRDILILADRTRDDGHQ